MKSVLQSSNQLFDHQIDSKSTIKSILQPSNRSTIKSFNHQIDSSAIKSILQPSNRLFDCCCCLITHSLMTHILIVIIVRLLSFFDVCDYCSLTLAVVLANYYMLENYHVIISCRTRQLVVQETKLASMMHGFVDVNV